MTVTLNFSSLSGRFNILDSEVKEESSETADACVEIARLVRVLADQTPSGQTDEITVHQDADDTKDRFCTYKFITDDNVDICAEVYDSFTFYKATFNAGNEIANFTEMDAIPGICGIPTT